ncbi:hypothetical protein Metme_4322 [Methylomonas methanica MC09]|uniref:Uncharacterized protein n=1 Tax=Methylomonas methanica (strain DSM 25384 / MC09) TaxID=857087 RepID=G0A312_METMM|nr:hypothetical protein Metme_4322 [Methylomonas methanica MC09]
MVKRTDVSFFAVSTMGIIAMGLVSHWNIRDLDNLAAPPPIDTKAQFYVQVSKHVSVAGDLPPPPRRAPEGLSGIARRGAAGMLRVYVGAGKPLRKTPFKPEERRKQAAAGCRFFWVLFFGQAKKSTSAVGPRPDIQKNVAIATHNKSL